MSVRLPGSLARRLLGWSALAALALPVPRAAAAQSNSGALDLLIPIGARATALGTAYVAEEGSEAIWWNPAGIARLRQPEFAIDHSESAILKGDAVSFIVPIRRLGAVGLTARLFNFEEQPALDESGNETGTVLIRSIVVAGSFATSFGSKVNAGVTYRLYQFRNDCSGFCDRLPTGSSTTSAVDIGGQYQPLASRPLRIGLELRNVGLRLQVKDQPQADALPTRWHLGLSYDPTFAQMPPTLKLRGMAELVSAVGFTNGELRVGAQAGYDAGPSVLLIRGGYIVQQGGEGGLSSGPSIGLGISSRRVQLDLARIFESVSAGLGKPPTYISIRVGL